MALSVLLLIGASAFSARWIAGQHDELARENSATMVGSALESHAERIATLSNDYAFWDPYYEAVLANDYEWLYPNVGVGVEEGSVFEIIAQILPGHDRHQGWNYEYAEEMPISGMVDEGVLAKVNAALDETATTSREGVTTYEVIDGETWLFAANRITPWEGLDASIPDREIPRQIMGVRINEEMLSGFNDRYLLQGMDLSTDAPTFADYVELKSVDGETVGYVSWRPPAPGAQIMREVPTTVLVVIGVIIAFMTIAAVHVQRNARRLEAALEREKLANRHKDGFIATISHELRTPLTSITASIDMLSMGMLGELPEKAKEVLMISDRNAKILNSLIEDLLLIGAIDSGNLRLKREPTEMNTLLRTAVENFRGYANEQGVTVELQPEDAPVETNIDARKVNQVITNLLSNAAKFSPDGGIVRVAVKADADKIRVSVSDDGIGIPPGREEDVFGRFRQVDNGDNRKHNGTGVGLSIAKEIMSAHGGKLEYESELGVGATFFMEFGRDADAGPHEIAASAEAEPSRAAA